MASSAFTVSAPPATDTWRKPPSTNRFNSPTAKESAGAFKSFESARITVHLPQEAKLIQYDQGGIMLSITKGSADAKTSQWLKSGIEFFNGKPWVGTVGCDRWADWSIIACDRKDPGGRPTVTLLLERSKDELGKSLWVYVVEPSADGSATEKTPIREVGWLFADEEDDVQLTVSAYAARPQQPPADAPQELEVAFDDFEVRWR